MKAVIFAKISRLIFPKTKPFFNGRPVPVFLKTLPMEEYDESQVLDFIYHFAAEYPATEFRVDVWIKGRRGYLFSKRYDLAQMVG